MSLQKWTLVVEITSAAAVVITLVFLVVGMRENTNAIQANTYQELVRDENRWRASQRESGLPLTMTEIAETLDSGTTKEVSAIRLSTLELWGVYEAAYFANGRGVLGESEWLRFQTLIRSEKNNEIEKAFWNLGVEGLSSFSESLSTTFTEYVEGRC